MSRSQHYIGFEELWIKGANKLNCFIGITGIGSFVAVLLIYELLSISLARQ
jgi:hypothetical protein